MDNLVTVYHADCLDVLSSLPDGSVDSIVTDPPAGIAFMSKEWDRDKGGRTEWVAWMASVMAEALRVTKPGGYALVWAIPRTSHWTATGIEDAGWVIRDCIVHLFGSGFPKSHNLPGGLGTALKPASEHWWLARKPLIGTVAHNVTAHGTGALNIDDCRIGTSDDTSRKAAPQAEGSVYNYDGMALGGNGHAAGRWPANVVLSAEQAAELDRQSGDRAPGGKIGAGSGVGSDGTQTYGAGVGGKITTAYGDSGGASRFFAVFDDDPCHVHDIRRCTICIHPTQGRVCEPCMADACARCEGDGCPCAHPPLDLAETFRYVAKAPTRERPKGDDGTAHPTVKPLALMRWLVRLVTPPGGVVLEPFAGSGTTVEACLLEGFRCIAVERQAEYLPLIDQRIRRVVEAPPVPPVAATLFDAEGGAA